MNAEQKLFRTLSHEVYIRGLHLVRDRNSHRPGRFGKYYIASPPFVLDTHVDLNCLAKKIAAGKLGEPIEGRT